MKRLLSLFILLGFSANAQNPTLTDTTWYLTSLVQNGTAQTPPYGFSVPYSSLTFTPETDGFHLTANFCNWAYSAGLVFNDAESSFTYEMCNFTLGVCVVQSSNSFDNDYMGFFASNTNAPLTYAITGNENEYGLTITALSGDKAIYNSTLMGKTIYEKSLFSVSPNPTAGLITLVMDNYQQPGKISLFNALGQEVMSRTCAVVPESLDLSWLQAGVYVLEITAGQQKSCKKIVKL